MIRLYGFSFPFIFTYLLELSYFIFYECSMECHLFAWKFLVSRFSWRFAQGTVSFLFPFHISFSYNGHMYEGIMYYIISSITRNPVPTVNILGRGCASSLPFSSTPKTRTANFYVLYAIAGTKKYLSAWKMVAVHTNVHIFNGSPLLGWLLWCSGTTLTHMC